MVLRDSSNVKNHFIQRVAATLQENVYFMFNVRTFWRASQYVTAHISEKQFAEDISDVNVIFKVTSRDVNEEI